MVREASSLTPAHNPERRLIEPAIERVLLAPQNRRAYRMRTLAFGHHEDRAPYAANARAAMRAFAKSWRRE